MAEVNAINEEKKPETKPLPPKDPPHRRPFRFPEFPDLKKLERILIPLTRLVVKGLVGLTVLTGFAEKKTQDSIGSEPPKSVINVGTLGMTMAKIKVNNGNKETDFDANMILAKSAREVVGKAFPQEKQDQLYEDNPIENGVFGKSAANLVHKDNNTLLKEASHPIQQTPPETTHGISSPEKRGFTMPTQDPRGGR